MYSDVNDELKNMTTEEVCKVIKEKGRYLFTDDDGIDIEFRYYSNLEINTADLYAIIQELQDNGKEPICLILDYLKKIESTRPNGGDERVRLSNVSKELKALAFYFTIPVITAMQINRSGNSVVDAAMREGKQDLLNFVGSSDIGVCWDIVEEADWVGIVSLERQISTGKLFLSCKRTKIRGKKDLEAMDYFNHPFANEKEIRLETDVDKPFPVSIISLASDLETVDTKELEKNGQNRPKLKAIQGGGVQHKKTNDILQSIKCNKLDTSDLIAI